MTPFLLVLVAALAIRITSALIEPLLPLLMIVAALLTIYKVLIRRDR